MDMFWTSSSWRRTFTFRKRSIRTIRVTFRCCLFLTAKVRVIMVYWSCLSTKVHASLYGVLNIELSGTNFLGLRLLITLSLLIGKTLRTRTNSVRRFLWVKDSRIAVRTYTFSTRNWNLSVTFLKMYWTDSWIAECLKFLICSLIENFPLFTLIGPCRKEKIIEIRSFLTPTTTKSNSTILDHDTHGNKL